MTECTPESSGCYSVVETKMSFLFPWKFDIKRKLAPVGEIFLAQFRILSPKISLLEKLSWTAHICFFLKMFLQICTRKLVHKYLSFLYISASESHEIFFVHATLQRKSHICVPRKGNVWPQSKFTHSWVCYRFIYSENRSTYFDAAKYLFRIFGIVSLFCSVHNERHLR
jgi:hypothetical protein